MTRNVKHGIEGQHTIINKETEGTAYQIVVGTQVGMDRRCPDRVVNSLPISNGVVCYNETTAMSEAVYICSNDFTLMGGATRVCQNDGNWNGSAPQCIPGIVAS